MIAQENKNQITEIENMFELVKDNKDPSDVVLVCRNVLEKVIDLIFEVQKVKKPANAQLLELINNEVVQNYLDNDILIDALHFVRIAGINALHGKHIKRTQAIVAVDNIEYLLAVVKDKLENDSLDKNDTIQSPVLLSSITVPPVMNEFETRKVYIDLYLNEAGWEVVPPTGKTKLPGGELVDSGSIIPGKACSEIPVTGMNNASGIGFCDYVFMPEMASLWP